MGDGFCWRFVAWSNASETTRYVALDSSMPAGTAVDQASEPRPWTGVLETWVQAEEGGAGGGSGIAPSKAPVPQFHQPTGAAPPAVWRIAAEVLNTPDGLLPAPVATPA